MEADPKDMFMYWIREREHVRREKEKGLPKPWSNDPVFQTTYFCNVDREHDKVTKYVRERFNDQGTIEWALPNFIMARMVNKPSSLQAMTWPWTGFHSNWWERQMSQKGAWGGAYIVSTNGRKQPKHEYIAGLLEQAFEQFEHGPNTSVPPTCSGWHSAIQGLQGMGSFMAAQVVADLKNTPGHPLASADDWATFAAPGPGSLRGLSWFHDRKITPSMFASALASAREWCTIKDARVVTHLCNQNLQNCFCEYDKYMRVSSGTGRSKRTYDGQ